MGLAKRHRGMGRGRTGGRTMSHDPWLIVLGQAAEPASRTPLYIIIVYMCALFALGWISSRLFRGSSKDFFVASQSIGPFMLLMSVFGTTMTAFALVGSTGKAFSLGIGTYGLMASSSGLIHAACFFFVGIRMWSFGKKYGYVTQIQFFRDRFESKGLGYFCLLYTSPSPRDKRQSRMPSSA